MGDGQAVGSGHSEADFASLSWAWSEVLCTVLLYMRRAQREGMCWEGCAYLPRPKVMDKMP
jgi:hypothetical protein